MSDQPAKLTDLPELVAYLTAHALGLIWNYGVNPGIVHSLMAEGHHNVAAVVFALGIAVMLAVLLIFLLLRQALAKSQGVPRQTVTDATEIGTYLAAHVLGLVVVFFAGAALFRISYAWGVRHLWAVGLAMNIVSVAVVLLLFLFLRRRMRRQFA